MRKIYRLIVIFLVLVLINSLCDAKISNLRLCADPKCSEPISLGITQVNYSPTDKYVLAFRANVHVKIFSKSAGTELNYWGAEIQGRRGYVPKNLIREVRVLNSKLEHEVPTELAMEEAGEEPKIEQENSEEANETAGEPPKAPEIPAAPEVIKNVDPKAPEIEKASQVIENVDPKAPEVPETPEPKAPEIPEAPKVEENEVDAKMEEEPGFFSQMFGGSTVEEKEEPKKVQEPAPVTEDPDEEESEEEIDDDEEDYDEEEEEEDESTEETPESTEKPLNIEELTKAGTDEVFTERKILSTVEELPPQNTGQVSSEQQVVKEPEKPLQENPVTESLKIEETTLPKEPEIEVTTPRPDDTHYYPEEFVTEATTFFNKSEEEKLPEKIPEFKPIPPIQVEPIPPPASEEVKEPPKLPQDSQEENKIEFPASNEVSSEKEAATKEEKIEIPVLEVEEEKQKPESVPVAPDQPVVPIFDAPPLPELLPEVPKEIPPEVTTFPPIHQHLPPLLNVPPLLYPETPKESAEEKAEEVVSAEEKSPEVPEVPETPPQVNPDPPQETVTESVGVGSFEEVTKEPKEEEPEKKEEQEEVADSEEEKKDGGFFSGLFDSIKETLNMKIMKGPEKDSQESGESATDATTGCTDDFCYRPQSQELRHPMVSTHHPSAQQQHKPSVEVPQEKVTKSSMTFDEFLELLMDNVLSMSSLILYLSISAGAILLFTFGHYVVVQCSRERQLVFRLNSVERKLMVAYKENGSLKGELGETREKLTSIQDNSFGSNDMVIALRGELDNSELLREQLQEQVGSLEKELENAAEAGLELNRMVSELLSNQSGSDSIISSVEELQKQLNEQQNTILTINASLAEKSRENSELQVSLASQTDKFTEEVSRLREECNKMEEERSVAKEKAMALMVKVEEFVPEIVSLKEQIKTHQSRYEEVSKALTQSQSRVQVLEDCIKTLKQGVGGGQKDGSNFEEIMNVANLKTQLVATTKEKQMLKEKLDEEGDARKLLEDHVKIVREEVEKLRKEYNDAEKERLEAQTRLEVLTSYFKDKETQLQKELSVKEAMWMKSQGETTSTVEKIRSMQDEIQTLKSQNDALRAEIEAQRAAHKAQIASLENRAQESWLSARQAERRLEESRIESSTLRRKLTSFAENGVNSSSTNNVDSLTDAPSPLHGVENPGSPLMGVMPPPPFLPPPFMPPPPPFMPPGPFIPAEMRLPPLGRLMSPPPPNNRYSPGLVDDRDGRFSPDRGRYTPDRYHNRYPMSPYETETDVSPPPTPPPHLRSGGYRGYSAYSPPPQQSAQSHDDRVKQFKGGLSSGSADSLGPRKGGGSAKV